MVCEDLQGDTHVHVYMQSCFWCLPIPAILNQPPCPRHVFVNDFPIEMFGGGDKNSDLTGSDFNETDDTVEITTCQIRVFLLHRIFATEE